MSTMMINKEEGNDNNGKSYVEVNVYVRVTHKSILFVCNFFSFFPLRKLFANRQINTRVRKRRKMTELYALILQLNFI